MREMSWSFVVKPGLFKHQTPSQLSYNFSMVFWMGIIKVNVANSYFTQNRYFMLATIQGINMFEIIFTQHIKSFLIVNW